MTELDIFAEPEDIDVDALRNLGTLAPLAACGRATRAWTSIPKPKARRANAISSASSCSRSIRRPMARSFCLRYQARIVKPGEIETYHDQLGYWLWEPATGLLVLSLAIPRAQVALASGHATPQAKTFEVIAERGRTDYGICSTTFLERNFRTESFRMQVTVNPDGTWSYFEDTLLMLRGVEPFHHTDENTLHRIAEPTPNPLVQK